MAAGRSFKSLVGRRRRAEDEGEDEEGPAVVEDSLSEGSVLSDGEEDEADASSTGVVSAEGGAESEQLFAKLAVDGSRTSGKKTRKGRKNAAKKQAVEQSAESSSHPPAVNFKAMADTEAMLNGLKIDETAPQDTVDFEGVQRNGRSADMPATHVNAGPAPTNGHAAPSADRQRREHEEYKKRRDADPAFIPNRGNFFMHDTRGQTAQGTQMARGAWNGRARGGRGGANVGAPSLSGNHAAHGERTAEQPWKHDLHDTINEEPAAPSKPMDSPQDRDDSARLFPKPQGHPQNQQPSRPLSFSSTMLVGKVQIRVFMPDMKAPIVFSEVPWKQYTRLPDHRPPLRRDKPVRISLPAHTQRYIFPAPDRSFIFIPRQMRPNQQGFGRNAYQRSVGGYGYSSRRTSMYGGSMYAASVAASRRSSFASVARESAFSPVGSYVGGMPPTRPVVRLPHGSQPHFSGPTTPMGPLSGHQTPTGFQVHTFPLPQQPFAQGTPTTTVHQPRPQKAISVTGIESPAMLGHAPQNSESQPFQSQLPQHMVEQPNYSQPQAQFFSPRQQYMYPQQPPSGTPLSGIPEQAVHAQSFPPPPMMHYGGQPYYPPYPQQQGYYGYPSGPDPYHSMPIYAQPPQNYMMSPPGAPMPPPPPPQQPPSQPVEQEQSQPSASSQSGMVAHESNGMVFYLPASEAREQTEGESYQPAESFVPSYAMPGLPPPTPAPEGAFYYSGQMPMQYYNASGQQ